MKKKLLFTFLGAMMTLPAIAVDFEYRYEEQTLTYTIQSDGTAAVSKNDQISGSLIIPSVAKNGNNEYSVTSIGEDAFYDCAGLTSVTIPNSVTSIGESAFYHCSGLTSIVIPNSVTTLHDGVFSICTGLTSVTLSNALTSISRACFSTCIGLTSITIPESVTSIVNYAFEGCSNLTSVSIPNSVKTIHDGAFENCAALTSITIPYGITYIGKSAFNNCNNLTSVYYGADMPIEGPSNIFSNITYENAKLYLSENGKNNGSKTEPWKLFKNIEVYDFASVEDVRADADKTSPYEIYNLNGIMVGSSTENVAPGIYVVRQGNTAKKVMVK